MEKIYSNITLADLDMLSEEILSSRGEISVILFKGDLGAGKTTLAQKIVAKLGIKDQASSPTFSIVNEYEGPLYHFDLYRLDSVEELEDIGFFEYLDSGNLCLIEWPEIAEDYLDMPYMQIKLEINKDNERNMVISKFGD